MGNSRTWSEEITARVRRAIDTRPELSDHRVAQLTGIPKTTFDRRLDGFVPWNTGELEAVAKVLDCSPAEFIPPADLAEARAS